MNEKLEQLLATLSEEFQKALYCDLDTRVQAIADFPKTLEAVRQLVVNSVYGALLHRCCCPCRRDARKLICRRSKQP